MYTLLGPDWRPYTSAAPGTLGGNTRGHRYGRLDCPAARRAIARGGYVDNRVFFADTPTAMQAGSRPARCVCPPRTPPGRRLRVNNRHGRLAWLTIVAHSSPVEV